MAAAALLPGRTAVAEDLDALREQANAAASEISVLEHELAQLEGKKRQLDASIDRASQSLGLIELAKHETEARLSAAEDLYVERAIDAYKSGPTGNIDIILSAQRLPEMFALAEIAANAAEEDSRSLDEMLASRAEAEAAQARIDERKSALLASQARAEEVGLEIAGALSTRKAAFSELSDRIASLERAARAAARAAAAEAAGAAGAAGAASPSQALLDVLGDSGPSAGIPDGFAGTGVTFEGIASWYGPGFEGNLTASGDVFDSSLFTAASKELPLGSWLYVEHEGRGVVVLINDRGPYVGDRIIDLSRAAAQAIGISGLGWIKAEVLIKA